MYMNICGFTPWPFGPKGYCRRLRLCVCVSVRLSVRELFLVRMITRHIFGLESPNLHQTFIMMGYSRLLLKIGVIYRALQSHFDHYVLQFYEILLDRVIAPHRFGLESQNLHQTCIMGCSQLALEIGVIDLDLQDDFGHFDSEF